MWTQEKEERFLELTEDVDTLPRHLFSELSDLESERNEFIERTLNKQDIKDLRAACLNLLACEAYGTRGAAWKNAAAVARAVVERTNYEHEKQ